MSLKDVRCEIAGCVCQGYAIFQASQDRCRVALSGIQQFLNNVEKQPTARFYFWSLYFISIDMYHAERTGNMRGVDSHRVDLALGAQPVTKN